MAEEYALYFDGVNDYVRVPSTPLLNPQEFTITLWVKIPPGLRGRIITKGRGATGILPFWLDMSTGGALRFLVGDGPNSYAVLYPPRVNDDQWHFIVLILDRANKQMRMRVDQRPWRRTDFTVLGDTSSLEALFLGIEVTMSWPLRGTIDEVKIYNRVLKDYEIDYWYRNGQGRYGYPTELGLVTGYHLDEGSGTVCRDFSGHGHDGVITGALWTSGYVREEVINMPQVVSHVILTLDLPTEAPGRVAEMWAEGLKNKAEWINQKRKLRVPDNETFQNRLAIPSQHGFTPVIGDTFHSRAGLPKSDIVSGRAANVQRSFEKYQGSLDHAFETVNGIPAKRFKEKVDLKKDVFSKGTAERLLPFTGTRFLWRGPAAIAGLWLTGDVTTVGLLRAGDRVLAGGPFKICPDPKKPAFKAALLGRLVQAGAVIVKSGYDAATITRHNQLTNETVQGFVDPALDLVPFVAGGDSRVDYIMENGLLFLEIKVSKM